MDRINELKRRKEKRIKRKGKSIKETSKESEVILGEGDEDS